MLLHSNILLGNNYIIRFHITTIAFQVLSLILSGKNNISLFFIRFFNIFVDPNLNPFLIQVQIISKTMKMLICKKSYSLLFLPRRQI